MGKENTPYSNGGRLDLHYHYKTSLGNPFPIQRVDITYIFLNLQYTCKPLCLCHEPVTSS